MTTAIQINHRPGALPPHAYAGHLDKVLGESQSPARLWLEAFCAGAAFIFIILLQILTT